MKQTEDESEERKFIHDIAGPLGTAMFLIESITENLDKTPEVNAAEMPRMKKLNDQLEKMKTLLEGRRNVLIAKK